MRPRILLVSHGRLSQGFRSACDLIVGDAGDLGCLSLDEDQRVDDLVVLIREDLTRAAAPRANIVLTDLIGGATTQAALAALPGFSNAHLVAGANLALLLELSLTDLAPEPAGHSDNAAAIAALVTRACEGMRALTLDNQGDATVDLDDAEL